MLSHCTRTDPSQDQLMSRPCQHMCRHPLTLALASDPDLSFPQMQLNFTLITTGKHMCDVLFTLIFRPFHRQI